MMKDEDNELRKLQVLVGKLKRRLRQVLAENKELKDKASCAGSSPRVCLSCRSKSSDNSDQENGSPSGTNMYMASLKDELDRFKGANAKLQAHAQALARQRIDDVKSSPGRAEINGVSPRVCVPSPLGPSNAGDLTFLRGQVEKAKCTIATLKQLVRTKQSKLVAAEAQIATLKERTADRQDLADTNRRLQTAIETAKWQPKLLQVVRLLHEKLRLPSPTAASAVNFPLLTAKLKAAVLSSSTSSPQPRSFTLGGERQGSTAASLRDHQKRSPSPATPSLLDALTSRATAAGARKAVGGRASSPRARAHTTLRGGTGMFAGGRVERPWPMSSADRAKYGRKFKKSRVSAHSSTPCLNALPDALLAVIMSYLTGTEVARLTRINKHFMHVCSLPSLWSSLFLSEYGDGKTHAHHSFVDYLELYMLKKIAHRVRNDVTTFRRLTNRKDFRMAGILVRRKLLTPTTAWLVETLPMMPKLAFWFRVCAQEKIAMLLAPVDEMAVRARPEHEGMWTALLLQAATTGAAKSVVYLLEHGVSVGSAKGWPRFCAPPRPEERPTALVLAAAWGLKDLLAFCLEHPRAPGYLNMSAKMRAGSGTPLFFAAYYDRLEVVQSLIAAGASLETKGNVGKWQNLTALEVAVIEGNTRVVAVLAEAGAYVGKRSLIHARRSAHRPTLDYLLSLERF